MTNVKIAIVGASGFLGGEAVRLVEAHPQLELSVVTAGKHAGSRLREIRPGHFGEQELAPTDPDFIAENADVAILALPHGTSASIAAELLDRKVRVVDLGSDFRLKSPDRHRKYYGREAPPAEILAKSFYSLPELTGTPPAASNLIASPGCFATAIALLAAPLVGLLDRMVVFGVTGSSGAGAEPKASVHHSLRATNFVAYKPLVHQHLGELEELLGNYGQPMHIDFLPHSAPMVRGILVSAVVKTDEDLMERYSEWYAAKPCIRIMDSPPNVAAVVGSNRADLGVMRQGDAWAVFVAIDNLIKGGAGQAIQSLNLLFGWHETLGLSMHGIWP